MTARKLVEADAQIQTRRRHVSEECVAIASNIDTIPPAMVPRQMRDRWLRALRQAMRAVALVEERLAADPTLPPSPRLALGGHPLSERGSGGALLRLGRVGVPEDLRGQARHALRGRLVSGHVHHLLCSDPYSSDFSASRSLIIPSA